MNSKEVVNCCEINMNINGVCLTERPYINFG